MNPNKIKKKSSYWYHSETEEFKNQRDDLKNSQRKKTDNLQRSNIASDFLKQGETRLERKQSNNFKILKNSNY